MLIHPRSRIENIAPVFEHFWSPHFMAVQGVLEGHEIYVFNVYAPTDRQSREELFTCLIDIVVPHGALFYAGGDFNCTLHGITDRSYAATANDHDSPALRRLLEHWGLQDSIGLLLPDGNAKGSLPLFYERYHTYHYMISGELESSRLDRWYVNGGAHAWAVLTETASPNLRSDHKSVRLHLRSPTNPLRIKKDQQVYPVPHYAQARVDAFVKGELAELARQLDEEDLTPHDAALRWDALKARLIPGMIAAKHRARTTLHRTYRQKLQRLHKQHQQALQAARAGRFIVGRATESTTAVTHLARVITITNREWIRAKRERLFRTHTWRKGKTTKAFFKRISCKFADNFIPTLRPANESPKRNMHDKAEILADAWTPVFQSVKPQMDKIAAVTDWMDPGSTEDTQHLSNAEFITEAAVTTAINACKLGKACGPDRLGNDWYKAYSSILTPILTKLYKLWYDSGHFPASFLQANIFCIIYTIHCYFACFTKL
ncbi:Reverse transcriptase precursor [Phytophthora megakarya]|uniref:Reverse transcriptase n=1 Tax=Phytophthora megakarya TaxID=4795 RepID=A0A225W9K1_9STRA|nr:Reverse transcriptase precursor [Phytophthora megakarya]